MLACSILLLFPFRGIVVFLQTVHSLFKRTNPLANPVKKLPDIIANKQKQPAQQKK